MKRVGGEEISPCSMEMRRDTALEMAWEPSVEAFPMPWNPFGRKALGLHSLKASVRHPVNTCILYYIIYIILHYITLYNYNKIYNIMLPIWVVSHGCMVKTNERHGKSRFIVRFPVAFVSVGRRRRSQSKMMSPPCPRCSSNGCTSQVSTSSRSLFVDFPISYRFVGSIIC